MILWNQRVEPKDGRYDFLNLRCHFAAPAPEKDAGLVTRVKAKKREASVELIIRMY